MRSGTKLLIVAVTVAVVGGCGQKRAAPAPEPTPEPTPEPVAAPQSAPASQAAASAPAAGPQAYRAVAPVVARANAPMHQVMELATTAPQPIIVDTEPPDPVYADRPEQPGPKHVWTRGFWDWSEARWRWRLGAWRLPPTGYVFAAPHYELVNGRVVYLKPYWAKKLPAPSFGGKQLIGQRPTAPEGHQPGTRYAAKPSVGFRVGTRPAGAYRAAGPATMTLEVPPAAPASAAAAAP